MDAKLNSNVSYYKQIARCTSGCVVECRICNQEVAGLNLGWATLHQGLLRPSLRGRKMSVPVAAGKAKAFSFWLIWLILLADETQGVQVKL